MPQPVHRDGLVPRLAQQAHQAAVSVGAAADAVEAQDGELVGGGRRLVHLPPTQRPREAARLHPLAAGQARRGCGMRPPGEGKGQLGTVGRGAQRRQGQGRPSGGHRFVPGLCGHGGTSDDVPCHGINLLQLGCSCHHGCTPPATAQRRTPAGGAGGSGAGGAAGSPVL